MQASKKTHDAKKIPARAALPWGQAALREAATELLLEGQIAPSVVMGNLLAASANSVLDLQDLRAQPRPLGAEGSRVVADALRRSRLPNANVGGILEELMALSWRTKTQASPSVPARPKGPKRAGASKPGPAGGAVQPAPASPKAPIIVRRGARVSKLED